MKITVGYFYTTSQVNETKLYSNEITNSPNKAITQRPRLFVRVRMVKMPGYSYGYVGIARLFVRSTDPYGDSNRLFVQVHLTTGGVTVFDEQT